MDAQALYVRLGQLVANMPEIGDAILSPEMHRWLGQAYVLVTQAMTLKDAEAIKEGALLAVEINPHNRVRGREMIIGTVHRALAVAELSEL